MAATLYFSNRIEKLADRLAENLRLTYQTADPFEPVQIIVPNANLAKWLQLALSRRQTVVFNLQFIYLEEGLGRMGSRVVSSIGHQSDSDQSHPVSLLDIEQRTLQILYTLKNMALDEPALKSVFSYLFDQDKTPRPDFTLRIWQLSHRLARLFQEYEYHRAPMIEQWLAGKPASGADISEMALCQRAIYRWIYQHRQKINADVTFKESFFDYVRKAITFLPQADPDECLSEWHFFGLSHLSRFHLELMGRLQPYFTMHLYILNPSQEFWEDIPSATELRYQRQKGADLSEFPVEHTLLSTWGRPGRETVRMLCELTGYTIEEEYSQRFPETILGQLQQGFLTLSSPEHDQRLPQDRSIQIAACPGKRREVETVYNAILHNLAEDDDLNLTDIAVLVPDMAEYLPYIELVFSGSVRQMAYNLVDSGAGGQSLYGQAVLGLFSLIETQLSRKPVFSLLQNPCVMHRFKITHHDLTLWAEWVTALGIFKVASHQSQKNPNKESATQLFSWQQGLMRLRLGRIFTVTEEKPPKGVDHYQSLEPYADIQSNDPDSVERFCLVMEALFEACDTLQRSVKHTLEWASKIQRICQVTFSIPPEYSDENGVQTRLFQALTDLDQYEQLGRSDLEKSVQPLGLNDVHNYLKTVVTNLKGGRGDYLTSGVTIAELAPMRPIPFKIIFVLGLEAGSFPGRSDASALDLRRLRRQIGDVTLPERQRYLFLEILLSVREKLYLTYVSQDLDKDRGVAPSSILIQLSDYIEDYLLSPDTRFEIQQIPLSGYSAKYLSSEAVSPKTDILVNENIDDRIAGYGFHHLWPKVLEKGIHYHQLSDQLAVYGFDDLWLGAKERTNLAETEVGASKSISSADDSEVVTLDELRWFLLDPVNQVAKRRLGRVGQDPLRNLSLGPEDEPLYAEFPVDWQIATNVLNRVIEANFLDAGQEVDHKFIAAELDQVYTEFTRKNSVPQEPFATADKKTLLTKVRGVSANALKLLAKLRDGSQKYRRFVLGRTSNNFGSSIDPKDLFVSQAVDLIYQKESDSKEMTFTLSGVQNFIWQDQDQFGHILVPMAYEKKDFKFPKQLINAALFYLTAKAGKVPLFEHLKSVNLYLAAANGLFRAELTLDANQSQAYLGQLILDYQRPEPPLWLPWEVVQKISNGPFGGLFETIDDELRQAFKRKLTDTFDNNPLEKIGLLQSVITDDALDRAIQRFSIFPKLEKVDGNDL